MNHFLTILSQTLIDHGYELHGINLPSQRMFITRDKLWLCEMWKLGDKLVIFHPPKMARHDLCLSDPNYLEVLFNILSKQPWHPEVPAKSK